MHSKLFLISIFTVLIFSIACERDFSSIEKITDPFALVKPTSHDFAWEIDTLSHPGAIQIFPEGIWGSKTNDVWLVGHSDTYEARIWHWDGIAWSLAVPPGLSIDPKDIIGFNNSDVWIVGDFPNHVVHWDGSQWQIIDSGINNRFGMSIWGSSSSDLFFGFDDGLLVHYDGSRFTTYQTDTKAQFVEIFGLSSNNVYACGILYDDWNPHDSTTYYIYHFDGKSWSLNNYYLLTNNTPELNFPWRLWGNQRNILFGVNGHHAYISYNGNQWEPIFKPETAIWRIHGTDINNIFVAGYWGSSIYHFNGRTWTSFDVLRDLNFFGWAVFAIKDQVFIGGHNSYDHNAYVIRGKRK